jgi:hypothetical protein
MKYYYKIEVVSSFELSIAIFIYLLWRSRRFFEDVSRSGNLKCVIQKRSQSKKLNKDPRKWKGDNIHLINPFEELNRCDAVCFVSEDKSSKSLQLFRL